MHTPTIRTIDVLSMFAIYPTDAHSDDGEDTPVPGRSALTGTLDHLPAGSTKSGNVILEALVDGLVLVDAVTQFQGIRSARALLLRRSCVSGRTGFLCVPGR